MEPSKSLGVATPEDIRTDNEEGEAASGHSLGDESNKSSSSQDEDSGQEPNQQTGSSICSSDIQSGDFGVAVELKKSRSLTDSEKYNFLTKHFVPSANYVFPSKEYGGRDRSFQLSWIEKHNGLVYSEKDCEAYCKYCVLFAEHHDSRIKEFGFSLQYP